VIVALLGRLWAVRWLRYGLAIVGALLAFNLWLRFHDAGVRREQKAIDRATYEQALQEAELLAIKARNDAEEHYRKLADDSEAKHSAALADAGSAARDYIRHNRLRSVSGQGSSCAAVAAAGDQRASLPESPAATAVMVAVSEEDVNACTGAAVYAMEAHRWAKGLGERSAK
jgi:hypothetical protein